MQNFRDLLSTYGYDALAVVFGVCFVIAVLSAPGMGLIIGGIPFLLSLIARKLQHLNHR